MRIISKGSDEVTCRRCGCKFEYEYEDLVNKTTERVGVFGTDMGDENWQGVECPQCGEFKKIRQNW